MLQAAEKHYVVGSSDYSCHHQVRKGIHFYTGVLRWQFLILCSIPDFQFFVLSIPDFQFFVLAILDSVFFVLHGSGPAETAARLISFDHHENVTPTRDVPLIT